MNLTDDYKKEVLQCRSCNHIFHQSDVNRIQTWRYGLEVNEGACPECGSRTYGVVDYPVSEEELLYKNGKFYPNYNRELKLHMDHVTDEILEKDRKMLRAVQKVRRINERYIKKYKLGA